MPLGDIIDDPTTNDEYVAQLLASEAKDTSLKYSALGLDAYLPRRPTDRAPRPNTRFLKNILRDTDTHNAALRRKEEQDARDRMRRLRGESSSSALRERRRDKDRRHRSRSPLHRDKDRSARRQYEDDSSTVRKGKGSERRRRRDEDYTSDSDRGHESALRSRKSYPDEERRSKRARRDSSQSRHHSSRHRHHHRDDKYKRSRSQSRSRSPHTGKGTMQSGSERRNPANDDSDVYKAEDSDPLEDLVGPLPNTAKNHVVTSRGRGSYRPNTSTIDSHFARDYNPKLDVDLSDGDDQTSSAKKSSRRPVAGLMTQDENEDWNMALEALRDRAHWRQRGEERLRAAGFDETTVQRWKADPAFANGASQLDGDGQIESVKWAKKGEGREWDRGKILNEHGHFEVKAEW